MKRAKRIQMNVRIINRRIKEIEDSKDDFEKAHGLEISLYGDFVLWCAAEKRDAFEVKIFAEMISRTDKIEFGRYTT
jgi:hypothetical protein